MAWINYKTSSKNGITNSNLQRSPRPGAKKPSKTQEVPPHIPITSPTHPDAGTKTLNAMVSLFPVNRSQRAFSNLTGRFPHASSRGHEYIFVLYHYDSNAILAEPVKNWQAATLTKAWEKVNTLLKNRGEQPLLYILDNEISQDLRKSFIKNKVVFQLVPPHMHRRNAAEREREQSGHSKTTS